MPEYIICDALDGFKSDIVDEFIRLCRGNDYNKLTLLKIDETINQIYDKHIEHHSTADVVEVVRCKDCEHQRKIWHKDNRMKEKGYYLYSCDRNSDPFVCHTVDGNDNDFCSYGKRKEGAD